jgi:polyphenol oxidase
MTPQCSYRRGADGIYRCDAFQEFLWQSHGFGTRENSPHADVTLRQIHSTTVLNADGLSDREREGDALVTDRVGLSIGVRTADCVPILLLDSRQRSVAAVHAGWRGTANEIVKHTIQKMVHDFRANAEDLYAAIGPCVRACCYRVGPEVAEQFRATFPEWDSEHRAREIDLAEANKRQMETAGMRSESIFDSCLCTTCQSAEFFSFRREPQNPRRMVAAIARLA